MGNLIEALPQFNVACLFYEICGGETTMYDEAEYDIYGDDWMCEECLMNY